MKRAGTFPGPLYTNKYTNAARRDFSGQGGLHRGSGLISHARQHV